MEQRRRFSVPDAEVPCGSNYMRQVSSAPEPRHTHMLFENIVIKRKLYIETNREVNLLVGKQYTDVDCARDVVVKETPRLSPRCPQCIPSPLFIEAISERDALLQLTHSNIVKMHEYKEVREGIFLVMEYAEQGDMLDHVLERTKVLNSRMHETMSEKDVIKMFRPVVEALCYMHDNGWVHCDVKLDNIFIRGNGDTVLGDFGKARQYSKGVQTKDWRCGTIYYTCPEVLDRTYAIEGPEMDAWSLGISMYCALYGLFPFYAEDDNELKKVICRRDKVEFPRNEEVSKKMRRLIESLLHPRPSRRLTAHGVMYHRVMNK